MPSELIAEKLDTSFRNSVYDYTRKVIHDFLYDGERIKWSEQDALKWIARRARQELDIAELCESLTKSENLDYELRSYISQQASHERDHYKLFQELVDKYGNDENRNLINRLKSPKDVSKEWEDFILKLKSEDPLVALINLEYGHEIFSEAGLDEMQDMPYKHIAEVLKRVNQDERKHGEMGKIVLKKYLNKADPTDAENVLNEIKKYETGNGWFFTKWN